MSDDSKPPDAGQTGRFRTMTDEIAGEVRSVIADFGRELKSELVAEIKGDMAGLRSMMREHTDRNMNAHEGTRRQVVHLTRMTTTLWRDVRGSEPPPPPPAEDISFAEAARKPIKASSGSMRALDELNEAVEEVVTRVSTNDNDIAGIHGQLLAINAGMETAARKRDEEARQRKHYEAKVDQLLDLQKEQMGKKDDQDKRGVLRRIADMMIYTFREREGQKNFAIMVSGLTGLIGIITYLYALITGHPPPVLAPPTLPPH